VAGPSSIPAGFADPDCPGIGRDTSGHVASGHGIHYCLGAPLARIEAEVALGALPDRFPRLSLAVPPRELRWRPVSVMNGLESLPASGCTWKFAPPPEPATRCQESMMKAAL
jgi:cytochrome P450